MKLSTFFYLLVDISVTMINTNQIGIENVVLNVEVAKEALNFSMDVFDVYKKNSERSKELIRKIHSAVESDQPRVTKLAAEVTASLEIAGNMYADMIKSVKSMCTSNIKSREEYFESFANHSDIYQRFSFLNTMINRTLAETIKALDVIDVTRSVVNQITRKLFDIENGFSTFRKKKREELKEVGEFVKETRAYVKWFEKSGKSLKQDAFERGLDVASIQGVAQAQKTSVEILTSILEDEENSGSRRSFVFKSIDKSINDIGYLCSSFDNNTNINELWLKKKIYINVLKE